MACLFGRFFSSRAEVHLDSPPPLLFFHLYHSQLNVEIIFQPYSVPVGNKKRVGRKADFLNAINIEGELYMETDMSTQFCIHNLLSLLPPMSKVSTRPIMYSQTDDNHLKKKGNKRMALFDVY